MKRILLILFIIIGHFLNAQIINFKNISSDKLNFFQLSIGLNMAVMANLEYGRILHLKNKPYVISANFTLPMGEDILDDSRISMNFSGNLLNYKNWSLPFHAGILAAFTNNKMSRISTLGSKFSFSPGYYKRSWFIGSDITYEKFFLSYIKNSNYCKEVYYDEAKNAWYYSPGGNFYLGIIAGKTIKNNEINLKLGYIMSEKFNTPLVPYYAQIAYQLKF